MLMGGSWFVGSAAQSKTAMYLGVAACFLLIVGEAALDAHPNWTVHTIGATGFFLLSMAAQCVRAFGAHGETASALRPKRFIAALNVALLALDGVLALLKAPGWTANLLEWLLSLSVVAFHLTFAYDTWGKRLQMVDATRSAPAPTAPLLVAPCKP